MELLAVLVVLSLLGAIALPAMAKFINSQVLASQANQVLALVFTARAEGAYRDNMLICSFHGQCRDFRTPDRRLILLADRNNNLAMDGDDRVVTDLTLPEGMTIQWRSFRNRPWLRISRHGVAYYQNGHFLLCYRGQARKVILNYQARARVTRDVDPGNCPM